MLPPSNWTTNEANGGQQLLALSLYRWLLSRYASTAMQCSYIILHLLTQTGIPSSRQRNAFQTNHCSCNHQLIISSRPILPQHLTKLCQLWWYATTCLPSNHLQPLIRVSCCTTATVVGYNIVTLYQTRTNMNIRTILNSEICKELLKHRNILVVTEDPQRVLHQVIHNI